MVHSRKISMSVLIRIFDILFSSLGLVILGPLIASMAIVSWWDTRAPLFFQERVGLYQKAFLLVKFRTMPIGTSSVATHLVDLERISSIGRFLRRTKLDELPQLWNVLRGDMSLVGPRPCLFNQAELIAARLEFDVFNARPGITGLAQIKGIEMSTPKLLARVDSYMLRRMSVRSYFLYIFLTFRAKNE